MIETSGFAMQIISNSPFPVATVHWRSHPEQWLLTVVCKATFLLSPGLSRLAPEQEPLITRDFHWAEDERRSLSAALEVVPAKACPEVILTGTACAPSGPPVHAMRVGLRVGSWEKQLEVFGDRFFNPAGELSAPEPFSRMHLAWERAAGGPGTSNPVGVPMAAAAVPGAWGRVPVPNLQARGTRLVGRHVALAPVGFGPITPSWPLRAARLPGGSMSSPPRWTEEPLPPSFDLSYFNAAPLDQQIPDLSGDERIVLENIDPHQPYLETKLEGVAPRALIRWASGGRVPVELHPDTLFIEVDRGLVSLVWRGQVPVADPARTGWVVVTLDRPSQRPAPPPPNAEEATATMAVPALRPMTLPFVSPSPPPAQPSPPSSGRVPLMTLTEVLTAASPVLPFITTTGDHRPSEAASADAIGTEEALPSAAQASEPAVPSLTPTILPPAGAAPIAPILGRETLVAIEAPAGAALPFVPPMEPPAPTEPPPSPQVVLPPPSRPPSSSPPTVVIVAPAVDDVVDPDAWPEPPPLWGPLADAITEEAPTAPAAAPRPTPAPPRKISIEKCAAIAASLARRPDAEAEVLEAREIGAETWAAEKKRWAEAMTTDGKQGRSVLRRLYDAAFVEQLERERGAITPTEYAELVVAVERGDPSATLARLDLPADAVLPVERVMVARRAADPQLRASVRAAISAARAG